MSHAYQVYGYTINLIAGWCGFLAGGLSGAVIGLFFHRADWLGGYASFRRRLLRLGHIACFGIGLINLLFVFTVGARSPLADVASVLLLIAMVTMPLTCFASAWREEFRRLFFIPAGSAIVGIIAVIAHLL